MVDVGGLKCWLRWWMLVVDGVRLRVLDERILLEVKNTTCRFQKLYPKPPGSAKITLIIDGNAHPLLHALLGKRVDLLLFDDSL